MNDKQHGNPIVLAYYSKQIKASYNNINEFK